MSTKDLAKKLKIEDFKVTSTEMKFLTNENLYKFLMLTSGTSLKNTSVLTSDKLNSYYDQGKVFNSRDDII